ncbi:Ribonuclease BN, tRNA processing enzyme [Alteribacillus persepolensis]|uniref:Ribonuclease Z n=1 Tax=Alteribacillus persepolensis TaxID=568899 RepID=A0A1G8A7A2_9BACI|nr:MBL fold metallo-hydrolase [Alteribacillus persepolensis]SDH16812.1 Ribonuclease BN, tRNA processing enzyme [Alteribacillus persepolensis]
MDHMKVIMLGTGSPRPDIERGGAAQVLLVGNKPILVDCGEGATKQLMKAGIPPETVNVVFFTHLHSDHLMGYQQFLLGGWTAGRTHLTIYGPRGLKKFHDTTLSMFDEDISYRTSLGKNPEGLLDVNVVEIEDTGEIPTDLPLSVSAAEMVHNVKTYAYRFEKNGKAVVFSGDTAPTPVIGDFSKGADILVQDAAMAVNDAYKPPLSREREMMWENLQKEHCTPGQAGEIGEKAGVKQLVLTHFLPRIDKEQAYLDAKKVYSGKVIVPDDLQVIEIEK